MFVDFKVWRSEALCSCTAATIGSTPQACQISESAYQIVTHAGPTVWQRFVVNRITGEGTWYLGQYLNGGGQRQETSEIFRCKLVTPGTQQF